MTSALVLYHANTFFEMPFSCFWRAGKLTKTINSNQRTSLHLHKSLSFLQEGIYWKAEKKVL